MGNDEEKLVGMGQLTEKTGVHTDIPLYNTNALGMGFFFKRTRGVGDEPGNVFCRRLMMSLRILENQPIIQKKSVFLELSDEMLSAVG